MRSTAHLEAKPKASLGFGEFVTIAVLAFSLTEGALSQTTQMAPAPAGSVAAPSAHSESGSESRLLPPGGAFVRASGRRLVMGANREVLLRGVVILTPELSLPEEKDYADIAAMHMNTVRLPLGYSMFYEPSAPNSYKESAWKWLDAHLHLARRYHLFLVLQMFDVEGAQFVPVKGRPFDYRIWEDAGLQDRFIKLWRVIAERYRDEPQIAGYSLFCEPVVSGTVEQWSSLATRTLKAIREVDRNHVVFVERIYGENRIRREMSGVDFAPDRSFFLVPDDNVVYEFYFFERDEYTHQLAPWRTDVRTSIRYPDHAMKIKYKEMIDGTPKMFALDKDYLKFYLGRQTEFGKKHNVPMFVWGFGALRNCFTGNKGGVQWLEDVTGLFNEEGLHWTFLAYRDDDFAGPSDNLEVRQTLTKALF